MLTQQPKDQHRQPKYEDNGRGKGGFVCRQSSSRWTPTSEQVRILKELYYHDGVRSPNAEGIQKISAMLSQHGRVEGKNVFYWFQNKKARERHKKRSAAVSQMPPQRGNLNGNGAPSSSAGVSSSSLSSGAFAFEKMGDCAHGQSAVNDKIKFEEEDAEIETLPLFPMHGGGDVDDFSNMMKPQPDSDGPFTETWLYRPEETSSRALLELSLNSYAGGCQE